jgi:UDP:flavonoid glycosyltransferase YjiC (YdhE family)
LIAVASEVRERGHSAVFCTCPGYREKIEALGFEFHPLRPDLPQEEAEAVRWRREIMDTKKGTDRLLRGFLFPNLRATYDDLVQALAASDGTDLLVSGEIVYAAPLAAEKTGVRWVSSHLSPLSFFSAYDPPILPPVPGLSRLLRRLDPGVNRQAFRLMRLYTRSWSQPVRQLRTELGLPKPRKGSDPIYDAKNSSHLVLAMFSSALALLQPDWPPNTVLTGFAFHDAAREQNLSELKAFFAAGEPPIVFTLGSAAVFDPGRFYEESARAAALLKRRAILLVGANTPSASPSKFILRCDYLPYSEVFPFAAAVVHQGGVGTTAQAMRAGCPMLIMPFSHDQPDNADRLVRLGLARKISRRAYSAERAATELNCLLNQRLYKERALKISRQIQKENGAGAAAGALENLLSTRPELMGRAPSCNHCV